MQLLLSGIVQALTALLSAKVISPTKPQFLPSLPMLASDTLLTHLITLTTSCVFFNIRKQDHKALLERHIHCNQEEAAFYKKQNRFPQTREKKRKATLISLKQDMWTDAPFLDKFLLCCSN